MFAADIDPGTAPNNGADDYVAAWNTPVPANWDDSIKSNTGIMPWNRIGNWHNEGANFLYKDGHVKFEKPERLTWRHFVIEQQ